MPQRTQLYEALMRYYTKQDLLEMARSKKVPAKMSQRKGDIARQVAEGMLRPEAISSYLCWLDTEDCYSFLCMAGVEGAGEELEEREELFPWKLLYTGYMFMDEDGGDPFLPEDVRKLARKVWTPELQATQRRYTWIRQCLELGTQLYGVMPYSILVRLLRQKVQYGMAVSALPRLLEEIPEEINPYGVEEKGIYALRIQPVLYKLEFPEDSEDYYIPSVMEIENRMFYTEAFRNLMAAKLNFWQQKFQQPFLDLERTLWTLCGLKSLECATCHMTELIALEGDPLLHDIETGGLTSLGSQLCRTLQKMDRHFRRVRYHGFTKDEWDERKNKQSVGGTWGQRSVGGEVRNLRTAKVISLDEQREKRKKK